MFMFILCLVPLFRTAHISWCICFQSCCGTVSALRAVRNTGEQKCCARLGVSHNGCAPVVCSAAGEKILSIPCHSLFFAMSYSNQHVVKALSAVFWHVIFGLLMK